MAWTVETSRLEKSNEKVGRLLRVKRKADDHTTTPHGTRFGKRPSIFRASPQKGNKHSATARENGSIDNSLSLGRWLACDNEDHCLELKFSFIFLSTSLGAVSQLCAASASSELFLDQSAKRFLTMTSNGCPAPLGVGQLSSVSKSSYPRSLIVACLSHVPARAALLPSKSSWRHHQPFRSHLLGGIYVHLSCYFLMCTFYEYYIFSSGKKLFSEKIRRFSYVSSGSRKPFPALLHPLPPDIYVKLHSSQFSYRFPLLKLKGR
ncbi:hypothetical protein SAY87_031574 [Trapa incisa]|uniref:Uncharacterized protein n=1 Tax=Trapa incisa TaxID=236973 RepID=A0AAN7KPZ5_9MYRT|nr:hypothetical protein SAY87_031574 [Trapa incisa]